MKNYSRKKLYRDKVSCSGWDRGGWWGGEEGDMFLLHNFVDPSMKWLPLTGHPLYIKVCSPLHLSELLPSLGCLVLCHSMDRYINLLLENYPFDRAVSLVDQNFLATP